MAILLEVEIGSDDDHDNVWPTIAIFAELLSKWHGVNVSVSDGFGTTLDFGE